MGRFDLSVLTQVLAPEAARSVSAGAGLSLRAALVCIVRLAVCFRLRVTGPQAVPLWNMRFWRHPVLCDRVP
jgi:hypothetical protein